MRGTEIDRRGTGQGTGYKATRPQGYKVTRQAWRLEGSGLEGHEATRRQGEKATDRR
jgi:hypothetical protein